MFERFTEASRRVLFFARYEAVQLGSLAIEPRHLLLGLLRVRAGSIATLLGRIPDAAWDELRAELRAASGHAGPLEQHAEIPFAVETRQVLELAIQESDAYQEARIDPAHLLLASIGDVHTPVAAFLTANGVRREEVQARLAAQRQASVAAHGSGALTVEVSPIAGVSLEPCDSHRAFGERPGIMTRPDGPCEAVLTNRSPRVLTAAVVRRSAVDPEGTERESILLYDDYMRPEPDGVAPGEQLLVSRRGFSRPVADARRGTAFVVSGGVEDDAVRVTVTLDSVVFEDGQLAGPDVAGIAERVHGRHAAEQDILARISRAEAAGENVQQMLESIANSPPNAPHSPRIIVFAMRALGARGGAGSFLRSRQPPQFWR